MIPISYTQHIVNPKPIHKPVYTVPKSNFVFKRNVPTLVFKDTVETTKDIKTPSVNTNSNSTVNAKEDFEGHE